MPNRWPREDGIELTPGQKVALEHAMTRPVTVVQGPPGTGKTFVLAEIVRNWRNIWPSKRVLVCCESNAACDNAFEKLTAADVPCIRVGPGAKHESNSFLKKYMEIKWEDWYYEKNKNVKMDKAKKMELLAMNDFKVVVATTISCGNRKLNGKRFPFVICDEAAQMTLDANLVPLRCGAKKLVLVGDHYQLPPVIHIDSLVNSYGISLFEKLAKERPDMKCLLDVQRRMHSVIAHTSNDLFYGGQILNGPNVDDKQRCPPAYARINWPEPIQGPLMFVDVHGNDVYSNKRGFSSKNWAEEEAVKKIVEYLPNTISIGIISMYKAQNSQMMKAFDHYDHVTVGTVDSFQGSERDIIILSTVRTDSIGFLSDWRRMNVAITRARCGLFAVGNAKLLRKDRHWKKFVDWCSDGGFMVDHNDLPKQLVAPPAPLMPDGSRFGEIPLGYKTDFRNDW